MAIWIMVAVARASAPMTICNLIRNPHGPHLEEWVEFHVRMGFGRIVLYDDHSSSNSSLFEIAARHPELEVVTPFPERFLDGDEWREPTGEPVSDKFAARLDKCLAYVEGRLAVNSMVCQLAAWQNCVERFRANSSWLTNIDMDEFVYPCDRSKHANVAQLVEANRRESNLSSARLQCLRFGPSGIMYNDMQLVLPTRTHRCPYENLEPEIFEVERAKCLDSEQPCYKRGCESVGSFKCLSHAAELVDIPSPHWHNLVPNATRSEPIAPGAPGGFCCNHYQFTSFEQTRIKAVKNRDDVYSKRLAMGCLGEPGKPDSGWFNTVQDTRILQFARGVQFSSTVKDSYAVR